MTIPSPLHLEQLPDFQMEVLRYAHQIKARNAAKAMVEAEANAQVALPPVHNLADFLAIPDEDTAYRIHELLPSGAHAIITAQYKAGKTTLLGNLVRSLVDGDPFLGRYEVTDPTPVTIIDNELDERTLRRWLRAQGIRNTHHVRVVSLRGRVSTFDLLTPTTRARWAQALHNPGVVLFDCLRPVLDALALDENRDAGRFLVAFDALMTDSGADEAVIVHHMGHNGERSRGDSRLQDWPDVTWKLVRQDADDPTSPRYFTAFGRDVNVPESALIYDETTRHLTLTDGNRKSAQAAEILPDLIAFIQMHPGVSTNGVITGLGGAKNTIRQALETAVETGEVRRTPRAGKGGGHAHFAN